MMSTPSIFTIATRASAAMAIAIAFTAPLGLPRSPRQVAATKTLAIAAANATSEKLRAEIAHATPARRRLDAPARSVSSRTGARWSNPSEPRSRLLSTAMVTHRTNPAAIHGTSHRAVDQLAGFVLG